MSNWEIGENALNKASTKTWSNSNAFEWLLNRTRFYHICSRFFFVSFSFRRVLLTRMEKVQYYFGYLWELFIPLYERKCVHFFHFSNVESFPIQHFCLYTRHAHFFFILFCYIRIWFCSWMYGFCVQCSVSLFIPFFFWWFLFCSLVLQMPFILYNCV